MPTDSARQTVHESRDAEETWKMSLDSNEKEKTRGNLKTIFIQHI